MASEKTMHAVVMHSDGYSGYVVRTAYEQADGSWWIPNPYEHATPVKLYKRECDADRLADRLNANRRQSQVVVSEMPAW